MNKIEVFSNDEFGRVRAMLINNEPWFVGKDVAEILGYADQNKAIAMHVDDEDKLNDKTALSLGQRGGWFINESGLYSLILSSKLPTAKKFKRWVTSEVLPSIRKTGGYIADQENMSDSELMAKALEVAHKTLALRNKRIEELDKENKMMKPKVVFADAVEVSDTSILVGELAKLISQKKNKKIGQNKLFEWLREHDYLMKKGSWKNMPTQRSVDMGIIEIKERTITNADGSTRITKTPKITGKGQIYFINKFLGDEKNEKNEQKADV